MKCFKFYFFSLIMFLSVVNEVRSEELNTQGNSTFGVRLLISITNEFISPGSTILLNCLSTNLSTNQVFFVETNPKAMYDVSMFNNVGERFTLASPANAGEGPETLDKISQGKSYACVVPFKLDGVKPGKYKIIAKQEFFIFRKPNHQDVIKEEVISSPIEMQIQ